MTAAATAPATTGRREFALALALCAAGAGLALLAGTRGWVTVTLPGRAPFGASARSVEPAVPALGLAALAGVVGLLATRRAGRRAVGALLVLAGAGAAVLAARHLADPSHAAVLSLLDARGRSGTLGDGSPSGTSHPLWPLLAMVGGVMVAGSGTLAVVRSGRWPGMSSRYEAPGPARSGDGGESANRGLWDALDRGEDPTGRPEP